MYRFVSYRRIGATAALALAFTLALLQTTAARAESERGPIFVQGHVAGFTLAFPPGGAAVSYPLEVAAGYHLSGRHEGFVVGLAQRFDVSLTGGSTAATMARLGWDIAIPLDPQELTIATYAHGGAIYGSGDAGGWFGAGIEGRYFPFEVWKPEVGEERPTRTERVVVQADRIDIKEKIQFKANEAVIETVSYPLLEEIATVIKANPHIRRLRIEGHASSEGDAQRNQSLSEDRAKAVREHLVESGGVDPNVVVSQGYGSSQPVADNETEEGRETNRRVEFNILEQDPTITKEKIVVDESGAEEGFYIVAKLFEIDFAVAGGEVVPGLTFQAGAGIAF